MGKKNKQISQRDVTFGCKQAKSLENPDSFMSRQPSWCFKRLDENSAWGLCPSDFSVVISHLVNFERMTWSEIFKQTHDGGRSSNHYIPPGSMCDKARKRFYDLHLDEYADNVYSLRISNKIRIFGLLNDGVFSLLWYDTKHEICPSNLKHT